MLKSYMYLKVKLLFDPPLGTASIEAINRQISELEWRINVTVDQDKKEEIRNQEYLQLLDNNDTKILREKFVKNIEHINASLQD